MTQEIRTSFVFYKSFLDAIEKMPEENQLEVYKAICFKAIYNEKIEFKSVIADIVFGLVEPNIEANQRKFENGLKGAEYGKYGGRPKKENNPEKTPKKPQENPRETPNVDVDEKCEMGNVDVDVDANEENINISLKEKINKKEKKSSVNSNIDIQKEFDLIFDETIKTLPTLQKENWDGFIEMRKSIKKPLSMIAVKQLKNKLIDLAKQKNDPNDVLSNSILNSYQGVFEVKEKKEVKIIRPWWEDFQPSFYGWDKFVLKQTIPENITAEEKKTIEKWIEKAKVENVITLEREENIRRRREADEEEQRLKKEEERLKKEEPEVFLELAKQRAREKTIKMLGRDLTTEYDEKEIMNNINKLLKGEAK